MCGIAGVHVFGGHRVPKLNALVDKLLLGIEHRGRDATGFGYVCDDGHARVQKASITASQFVKNRALIPDDARSVVLHTRLATNGHPAFPENNHPTVAGTVVSVHNGVIWNDDELFARIDYPRLGEVDSEVIPALVDHHGIGNTDRFLDDVMGTFALAYFDTEQPGYLMLVRGNHSPLYFYKTNDVLIWASTSAAIREAWAVAYGTPPAISKVQYALEGSAFAFNKDDMVEDDCFRFTPYPLVSKTVAAAAAPLAAPQTAAAPTKSIIDDEEDTYYNSDTSEWEARCSLCGEFHPYADLVYMEQLWLCLDCDRTVNPNQWAAKAAEDILDAEFCECDNDDDIDRVVAKVLEDAGVAVPQ